MFATDAASMNRTGTAGGSRLLVTGANGFVGRALCGAILRAGDSVRCAVRDISAPHALPKHTLYPSPGLGADADWRRALQGIDSVVHLAARVHMMAETGSDTSHIYSQVNTLGTLQLARQASDMGVRRFVFMSTLKIHGEVNASAHPFRESDTPAPTDAYAQSKLEAEQGLLRLGAETGMEIVIIRPPIVYGAGVKANFGRLMHAVNGGRILPVGAIRNRRSMVALDNLVDFTLLCTKHASAANQSFLISDGQDLSTPELVRGLAKAAGKTARLPSIPMWMLRTGASALGQQAALQRLCDNLYVDIAKARELLGWTPPLSVAQGLQRAMQTEKAA